MKKLILGMAAVAVLSTSASAATIKDLGNGWLLYNGKVKQVLAHDTHYGGAMVLLEKSAAGCSLWTTLRLDKYNNEGNAAKLKVAMTALALDKNIVAFIHKSWNKMYGHYCYTPDIRLVR